MARSLLDGCGNHSQVSLQPMAAAALAYEMHSASLPWIKPLGDWPSRQAPILVSGRLQKEWITDSVTSGGEDVAC